MLLHYQAENNEGLSQAQLGEMMLVNRANITTLIDRMEKANLVIRTSVSNDRRTNIIKLTSNGKKLFAKAEPLYAQQVKEMMTGFNQTEQKNIIAGLERVRVNAKK
jgi:DNA-binding MarR family transcriptional regulator